MSAPDRNERCTSFGRLCWKSSPTEKGDVVVVREIPDELHDDVYEWMGMPTRSDRLQPHASDGGLAEGTNATRMHRDERMLERLPTQGRSALPDHIRRGGLISPVHCQRDCSVEFDFELEVRLPRWKRSVCRGAVAQRQSPSE
jgi:hypothetical protein